MKKRYYQQLLRTLNESSTGRILVITGARQTGKTTLVKTCFPDYEYISLDDPVTRVAYASLTASQWHDLYAQAILDEVQKLPSLVDSVKAVYDHWGEPRYVLLGSSQLLLLNKVKESLAGRCHIIELYPLTLPEILTDDDDSGEALAASCLQTTLSNGELPPLLPSFTLDANYSKKVGALEHVIRYGSYPIMTDPALSDRQRMDWLRNYTRTYLERDVRDMAMMRDLEPYIKLQQMTALQTACVLNVSEWAKRLGMATKTVSRYLEYLRLSFQVMILPSWTRNESKRLTKAPKIHYMDTGVLRTIARRSGTLTGWEFESLVITEIAKQIWQLPIHVELYHLRTHDGREVDLLAETEEGFYAFEIKQTEHATPTDARHLVGLEDILDKPLIHAFVVSLDTKTHQFTDKITAIHAAYLLT